MSINQVTLSNFLNKLELCMEKTDFDQIIIGAGPAGLSAGIYAARAGYKTMILEKMSPGGQMMLTDVIDNYPGYPEGITGFELQDKMTKQLYKFEGKINTETVKSIERKENIFKIVTDENIYTSYSVIIATGARHRRLNIPGESEFASKGVSYCGTCDGPFFRNKNVAVIGGGDTALTEALFLSKFAGSVKVIHRRDRFRAVQSLVNDAENNEKISFIFDTTVDEINGADKVTGIRLNNKKTGEITNIDIDGVFIFVGLDPNTEIFDKSLFDESKYIKTDERMSTVMGGLFAAGDVRSGTFRQIVCACSDGAKAAEYAGNYIDKLFGNEYK